MPKKLAIIHTTPVTIETLKALAAEWMPETTVINLLDDSILPELAQSGGRTDGVKERWFGYAKTAESLGADCVLSACSSVGEIADEAAGLLSIPVLRIDEAMAETAVSMAGRAIGVAATLPTTLKPTEKLLERVMLRQGKPLKLTSLVAEEAYRLLMAGDREGHDRVLLAALKEMEAQNDVVVLAQASMARVVAALPEAVQGKFISSPRLGMERVKLVLEGRL